MKIRLFRKPLILAIGSAHMDVIGDFTSAEQQFVDKVGEISHSIGGTAFNIAVDIANAGGTTVALYTHLRAKSMVTDLIMARLHEEGVSTKYVIKDPTIRKDGGFVAHRQDGDVVSAVSSMLIDEVSFTERTLASAINRSSVVVAECNLSRDQLKMIANLCTMYRKILVVGGVSETKCRRIKNLQHTTPPIAYFLINRREAMSLVGRNHLGAGKDVALEICQKANASHVIVTEGDKGWKVFSSLGTIQHFAAPQIPVVRSTTGAGDALIAGLAHYLATNAIVDWAQLQGQIHRFVAHVMQKTEVSGTVLASLKVAG